MAFRRENCERSGWARDDRLFRRVPVAPVVRDFEACFDQSLGTLALETALGSRRHRARMLSLRGAVDLRGVSITLQLYISRRQPAWNIRLGEVESRFRGGWIDQLMDR